MITPTHEKGRALRAPAGTLRRQQCITPRQVVSSFRPRIPAQPEPRRPRGTGLRDAVALLILSLQDQTALSSSQQRRGWHLVERYLPEVIAERRVEAA